MAGFDMNEQVGVRDRCTYFILDDEPPYGRWWAVVLIPVEPPGELHPVTPDGAPVEKVAVIAAEKREDGTWQWIGLTPATRRIFGDMLVQQNIPPGTWAYVMEVDMKIAEMADAEEGEEAPRE